MGWFRSTLKSLRRPSTGSSRAPKRSRSPVLDELEGRRLLSTAIQAIVSLDTGPASNLISGPDGSLWVGAAGLPDIASIDRIGLHGSVTSFPLPGPANATLLPTSLTTGPDGNVWFVVNSVAPTNGGQVVIGNVTPGGSVTEFPPIPVPAGQRAEGSSIVSGPGGDLWFVYDSPVQGVIARVTTAGSVTLFPAPSFGSGKQGEVMSVAAGADGNLWFTEELGKHLVLGRMSPSGTAATPVEVSNLQYGNVADGPGSTLIVSGQTKSGRSEVFQVSTAGAVTRFKIPAASSNGFYDYLGAASGSLWFTSEYAAINGSLKIGRITQAGSVRSYNVSKFFRGHGRAVGSMALGTDGNMYVLDTFAPNPEAEVWDNATVYRISPSKIALVR